MNLINNSPPFQGGVPEGRGDSHFQTFPLSSMRRIYEQIIDLRPAWIGTGTTVALDHINNAVGILVGLATLVYLIIRISRELRK